MAKKMLIDASQPEETRVAVVAGSRIEEFDFESATKKQITGNIYLAKVVRVEPSLQAAFVEYGGNRHGFLAFSEIHPDYYQIPMADRQALLATHAAAARKSAETYDDEAAPKARRARAETADDGDAVTEAPGETAEDAEAQGPTEDAAPADTAPADAAPADAAPAEVDGPAQAEDAAEVAEAPGDDAQAEVAANAGGGDDDAEAPSAKASEDEDEKPQGRRGRRGRRRGSDSGDGDEAAQEVESLGGDDSFDDMPRPRFQGGRPYKIQEVIKRRQILLVQVVKEERGTKGAALTTYLSLAGRYCVLMPNTGRGGGISRKITNAVDRKRLKAIATDLDVPEGMGLIVRTAGANRTKVEIKRDFEYLLRLWENVRETTLKSVAPALILEEGSLIKRAIRDLYSKDIESVQVEGEEGYREAKEFMRMLMPSHAKNVQAYRDPVPLFLRTQVENQLDGLFSPQVQLKSGGYLVIDQTEALVAIDVNSGRSTREHNIEDTALKTNLEAADEVARQLRLRDLAGLIVVDFIDMEDPRNNRAVERRLKDALKVDRARIQVGRISAFGLLEMSRQRLRSSVMEISSNSCPMCNGAGVVRSVESTTLHVIRGIEEEGLNGKSAQVTVRLPHAVAMFLLNQKRDNLRRIEDRYGFQVIVEIDHSLIPPDYRLERFGIRVDRPGREDLRRPEPVIEEPDEPVIEAEEAAEPVEETRPARASHPPQSEGDGSDDGKRRRRRRRRRRGRREDGTLEAGAGDAAGEDEAEGGEFEDADGVAAEGAPETAGARADDGEQAEGDGRRRRRGRRGGRRARNEDPAARFVDGDQPDVPPEAWVTLPQPDVIVEPAPATPEPAPETSPEPGPAAVSVEPETPTIAQTPVATPVVVDAQPEPAAPTGSAGPVEPTGTIESTGTVDPTAPAEPDVPAGPPKKGWWRKALNI